MAAGDIFHIQQKLLQSDGRFTVAGLIGGTTYHYLKIKANGPCLVGNSAIDPNSVGPTVNAYRLHPNEEIVMENNTATAGMIDGAKINIFAANGTYPIAVEILAIANV